MTAMILPRSTLFRRLCYYNQQAGRARFSSSALPSGVVGFLGLGNMGLPMAVNLSKCREVVAFDLNQEARIKAQEQGVDITVAASTEQVIQASSIIVTMLPGDAAVNQVMELVMKHCPTQTTVVDCSTVSPTTSRYWHQQLAEQQGQELLFVDAPVSGGVKGAQNASLTFMVGSTEQAMQHTIQPLLGTMGQRVIACGGPGAGAAVKLCNNLALACQMVGICEAMNLGEALGVDPVTLANVMNTSTAKSWSCEVNNPHPVVARQAGSPASKDYEGGFGTKLMLKDLGLAVEAGTKAHVALPLGTATKELYQLADLRGHGQKDFGVILEFLRGK